MDIGHNLFNTLKKKTGDPILSPFSSLKWQEKYLHVLEI